MTDISDAGTADATTAPVTDAPSPVDAGGGSPTDTAPVTTAPVTTAPVAESDALDLDLPAGMQQFDRTYVEKLRAEAAKYRTTAKEHAVQLERFSAFDGYDDNDMGIWTQMASDWKSGNYAGAATTMQEIAKGVLGDANATPQEQADAQAVLDDPDITAAADSLDADTVRQIVRDETAAQTEARERDEAVKSINDKIASAGFEQGTSGAFAVLWHANNTTNGDIDAAIAAQKADQQKVIDDYVSGLSKGGNPVRLPSDGTGGTPPTQEPANLADAGRLAREYMRERQSQR